MAGGGSPSGAEIIIMKGIFYHDKGAFLSSTRG
jgi:hypothetical protein